MKGMAFITSGDAEYGFRLTGVSQYVARAEDATDILKKIIRESEVSLVIIDERLITEAVDEKLKAIEKTWDGILLALPAPERVGVEIEDFAMRLIKSAIGYHVKLTV